MILRTRKRQILIFVFAFLFLIYFDILDITWDHYFELFSLKPYEIPFSQNLRDSLDPENDLNFSSSRFPDPSVEGNISHLESVDVEIELKDEPRLSLIGNSYDNEEWDEHSDYITDEIPGDDDLNNLISDYEDVGKDSGVSFVTPAKEQSQIVYGKPKDEISSTQITQDIESYKAIEGRFAKRLERVQQVCQKYKSPGFSQGYTKRHLLYYSPRYNLLVCLSAKVGSSTWKSHLLHMKGINPVTNNIHRDHWENKIKARKILGGSLERRLATSTMVVTVRHPLDRLVSAFRDKFCDGRLVDKPQSSGHSRYFWRPAYRLLRKKKRPDGKLQITFHEFLRYVIRDQKTSGVGDRHWSRLFRGCSVCTFRYKYVMKLETYTEDLAYLTYLLNVTEFDVRSRRHSLGGPKSPHDLSLDRIERNIRQSTLHYYNDIPASLLASIFNIYKIDFEMFDYEIPEVLRKKVTDIQ
ncbi:carbohydrate sulfotransferase 13-like [Macrobrachium rosenbergii]|uniref:carbohydrate sulfotransferase 13-like n=1 Tax=Macrobrachium rosenbergii TaxID=79674 RepID=UPI0034D3C6A2